MVAAGRYLAGVGVALCTTFMSALGLSLQKRSHLRLEGAREAARRRHVTDPKLASYRQPLWLLGLSLLIASSLLSLAVFALVGQSVASAFASITIVWNLALSYVLLQESLSLLDLAVSALMITGTVLVVVFGSKTTQSGFLSLDDILALLQRPAAWVGWGVFGTLAAVLVWLTLTMDRRVFNGLATRRDTLFRVTLYSRAVLAGIFSGCTGFLSKACVSIFASSTGEAGPNLGRWEPWVFLILLPVSLVLQITFLNSALRSFPATEAVPIYQANVVLWGTIFGWTLYAEGAGKTGGQIVGFIAGILVIVVGCGLLLLKRRATPPEVTLLGAVQALAVGELMTQVTGLRRARTAPGGLAETTEAVLRCRTSSGNDCAALSSLRVGVPVQSTRGTTVATLLLVHPDAPEPVSPRELLRSPRPEGGDSGGGDAHEGEVLGGAAGATRGPRLPPALLINVLLPAGTSQLSEPARDQRYRTTASVALVAELLTAQTLLPLGGVPPPNAAPPPAGVHGEATSTVGPATSLASTRFALDLYLPTRAADFWAGSMPFSMPADEVGGQAAEPSRTVGGSVRRVYPSLRRLIDAVPRPAPGSPQPPQHAMRPARERVLTAPAVRRRPPPPESGGASVGIGWGAEQGRRERVSQARTLAVSLTPAMEDALGLGDAQAGIAPPARGFRRRFRSAAPELGSEPSGAGDAMGGTHLAPVAEAGEAELPYAAAAYLPGRSQPSHPPVLPDDAAMALPPSGLRHRRTVSGPVRLSTAAGDVDVPPPRTPSSTRAAAARGGLSRFASAVSRNLAASRRSLSRGAQRLGIGAAAATPLRVPPRRRQRRTPAALPALVSLPLAVVQTLPGVDAALLAAMLRAESNPAMVEAREAPQRAQQLQAAQQGGPGGLRRWLGLARRPPLAVQRDAGGAAAAAAPAAFPGAAAAPWDAGGGAPLAHPVDVEQAGSAASPPIAEAHGHDTAPLQLAGQVAVVPGMAGTGRAAGKAAVGMVDGAGGVRRRQSLSDVRLDILAALALQQPAPPPPAAAGTGLLPPSADALARRRRALLSGEPVLALAQAQSAGTHAPTGAAASSNTALGSRGGVGLQPRRALRREGGSSRSLPPEG